MKKHSKTTDIISLIVFSIGAMIGIAFNGLAAWADFEASLFDSALRGDDQLSGLRCPVFIGSNETGRLSAEIKNPLDRTIAPKIRAHVSDGFVSLLREIDQQPSLAPGATQTLEWTVTPADAVWGRFILFRAYQYPGISDPNALGHLRRPDDRCSTQWSMVHRIDSDCQRDDDGHWDRTMAFEQFPFKRPQA